jgi:DNA repair photolyase
MAIHEIQAKQMLSHHTRPDPWFGLKYTFNIYRGCQHRCIYCDSRSACYGIEDFDDVLVKVNAIERLAGELPRKRTRGLVGTGSMSDPYGPIEAHYGLTRQALELLARHRYPLHLITKSDLVLRDVDLLARIAETAAYVSFTITTADDDLAARLEPAAPSPTRRLAAMATLAGAGVMVGVTMMPILPFIEDSVENITAVVEAAVAAGATYVLPGFGVTLRDRQRDYYYAQLDVLYPGLRRRYEQRYGESYHCACPTAIQLQAHFEGLAKRYGLRTCVPPYEEPSRGTQLSLL